MTADTVGGVWTYALDLADAMQPLGVQYVIAAMGGRLRPDQREAVRVRPHVTVIESEFRLEWMDDPWDSVDEAGQWLLELEKEYQPDFVHLNNFAHGTMAWSVPTLMVLHSCVVSWWRAVLGDDPPPRFDTYRSVVRRGMLAVDQLVTPTHVMAHEMRRCHHLPSLPRTIYNGSPVIGQAARDQAREDLGARDPVVMAAGRLWDDAKNIDLLLRVAPQLNAEVQVAGPRRMRDGRTNGPTKPRQSDDEVRNGVRFLGEVDHPALMDRIRQTAIYCLPARYEPFGLSILEAASCGCALVLGDIPTLRELWQDAAVFVAPDDEMALEHALRELIEDPEMRAALAQQAQRQACHYSLAAMARGYARLYENLVARQPDAVLSVEPGRSQPIDSSAASGSRYQPRLGC